MNAKRLSGSTLLRFIGCFKDRIRGRNYPGNPHRSFPNPGLPGIAFITFSPTACSDLVLEPLDVLHRLKCIDLAVLFECRLTEAVILQKAIAADIVVLFRPHTNVAHRVALAVAAAGKVAVVCTDDDLITMTPDQNASISFQQADRDRIDEIYRLAESFWVFSPVVRERYLSFGRPVALLKTFVTLGHLRQTRFPNTLRIGHIGDWTHAEELEPIVEMIRQLERQQLGIKWEFVFAGYTPPALRFSRRVRSIGYIKGTKRFHKWLDRQHWDIGIAPLRDSLFNRAKTANKYRTFAAYGIAGIYADIPVYCDAIERDATGLLVSHNAESYAEATKALMFDHERRLAIQAAAYDRISRSHSTDVVLAEWQRSVTDSLAIGRTHRSPSVFPPVSDPHVPESALPPAINESKCHRPVVEAPRSRARW